MAGATAGAVTGRGVGQGGLRPPGDGGSRAAGGAAGRAELRRRGGEEAGRFVGQCGDGVGAGDDGGAEWDCAAAVRDGGGEQQDGRGATATAGPASLLLCQPTQRIVHRRTRRGSVQRLLSRIPALSASHSPAPCPQSARPSGLRRTTTAAGDTAPGPGSRRRSKRRPPVRSARPGVRAPSPQRPAPAARRGGRRGAGNAVRRGQPVSKSPPPRRQWPRRQAAPVRPHASATCRRIPSSPTW